MAYVTVSRQYGAGGSEVARRVAEQLGWTVVDNEFVGAVAARAGVPVEAVAAHEERVPSLMARLARALAVSSPETFVPLAATGGEPDEANLVAVTERVIRSRGGRPRGAGGARGAGAPRRRGGAGGTVRLRHRAAGRAGPGGRGAARPLGG
jgi:hypothetical protein